MDAHLDWQIGNLRLVAKTIKAAADTETVRQLAQDLLDNTADGWNVFTRTIGEALLAETGDAELAAQLQGL